MALRIKFYPKLEGDDNNGGSFTAEDIEKGVHWLYADITCPHCSHEQAVSMTGYVGGPCIRCGKLTGG